jgi:hypothetical protein
MKLLELLKEALILEVEKRVDPCDGLSEGKVFCKNLQKILSTGTGGKGSEQLKKKSISIFSQLRNGDYLSMGSKVELKPGNRFYEERIGDMIMMLELLKSKNSCKAIQTEIEKDMVKLSKKNITMRLDDNQSYSLFNRINTHSSNQSFILSKLAQQINKQTKYKFFKMDNFDNSQIIEEVMDLLNDPSTLSKLDVLITELMNNEESQKTVMDAFNFTRNKGYEVEDAGWESLKSLGYEVYPFSDDFGFVDYFGIDLLAVDDKGVAHPVQVSSQMKMNPKIFQYQAPDCQVFALYKSKDGFIKYSPLK